MADGKTTVTVVIVGGGSGGGSGGGGTLASAKNPKKGARSFRRYTHKTLLPARAAVVVTRYIMFARAFLYVYMCMCVCVKTLCRFIQARDGLCVYVYIIYDAIHSCCI